MKDSWRGLAVALLIGLLIGGLPFGTLWFSEVRRSRTLQDDLRLCRTVVDEAKAAASGSRLRASELARKPLARIAEEAGAKPTPAAGSPAMTEAEEEMSVVSLERNQAAPFPGGLFGRVRFADAVQAMKDRDAWALAKSDAEAKELVARGKLDEAKRSAWRWKKKTGALVLGLGLGAYGLAEKKPWLAAVGGGLGVGGAILF